MTADDWVGDPEFLARLRDTGTLAEVNRYYDLQEAAELSGDYSAVRAFLGDPVSADEALRQVRALMAELEGGTA